MLAQDRALRSSFLGRWHSSACGTDAAYGATGAPTDPTPRALLSAAGPPPETRPRFAPNQDRVCCYQVAELHGLELVFPEAFAGMLLLYCATLLVLTEPYGAMSYPVLTEPYGATYYPVLTEPYGATSTRRAPTRSGPTAW
eukprot:3941383-Rhodomonas_salina.2